MAAETAGDPMTGLKWTRRTTARIAAELRSLGIEVCPRTVARLLRTMGFALRVNHKKRAGASHPDRDAQFQHIAGLRRRCAAENLPIVSVDTKKKELVGNFKNPGAKWDRTPQLVRDHDFRSEAHGIAIPTASTIPKPTPAPSSSAPPSIPPPSRSTASRNGGAPRAAGAIPAPANFTSSPTAAAAIAAPRGPGSTISSTACVDSTG